MIALGHKVDKQLWRVGGRFTQVVIILQKLKYRKMISACTAEKPCDIISCVSVSYEAKKIESISSLERLNTFFIIPIS